MMVKTRELWNHVNDLEEIFGIIRSYRMRHNPKKCVWDGVWKNLGILSLILWNRSQFGQVVAFMNMRSSSNLKKVQQLNKRIINLNIFIFKCIEKCFPFFKLFRRDVIIKWENEYKEAFQKIKKYLGKPLIFVSP